MFPGCGILVTCRPVNIIATPRSIQPTLDIHTMGAFLDVCVWGWGGEVFFWGEWKEGEGAIGETLLCVVVEQSKHIFSKRPAQVTTIAGQPIANYI